MKTLGVIGNSHLAALKLGWNQIKQEYPEVELVFFGKPLAQPDEMKLEGEYLVAANDEVAEKFLRATGRSRLSAKYDGYIICDLGVSSRSAVDFCRLYQPEGFSASAPIPVSLPCFRAALYGTFQSSFATSLVGQLRSLTDAPMALIPAPMRSAEHPDRDRKRLEESGDAEKLAEIFNDTLRRLAEEMNLRLFLQTGATLASPLRTHQPFTRAYIRTRRYEATPRDVRNEEEKSRANGTEFDPMLSQSAEGGPEESEEFSTIEKDFGHMNARYGATMLRLVLENFGCVAVKPSKSELRVQQATEAVEQNNPKSPLQPKQQSSRKAGWLKRLVKRDG